jgi:NTE family protein
MGLVLTGGGARGAYQAGVLRAVSELTEGLGIERPFQVLSGCSAGAINVGFLTERAEKMHRGCRELFELWTRMRSDNVFKVDAWSTLKIAAMGVFQLLSGGVLQNHRTQALLNTEPLRLLVEQHISVLGIQHAIESQWIDGLAVTAVNYANGYSHTFFQSHDLVEPWERIRRTSERAQISPDHIMASTALPLLFPAARVGDSYFGDGNLRNYTPLSAAIKLGAEKLLVIGVRQPTEEAEQAQEAQPGPGRIFSVLLNSVLLDALDIDIDRAERTNETIAYLRPWSGTQLRGVDMHVIRPSQDIGRIAVEEAAAMPRLLRYLLQGLGSAEDNEGLYSYLLFEAKFTQRLADLGYEDAMAQADLLCAFFSD